MCKNHITISYFAGVTMQRGHFWMLQHNTTTTWCIYSQTVFIKWTTYWACIYVYTVLSLSCFIISWRPTSTFVWSLQWTHWLSPWSSNQEHLLTISCFINMTSSSHRSLDVSYRINSGFSAPKINYKEILGLTNTFRNEGTSFTTLYFF